MLALGFMFGPVDGTLGAIDSSGTYTLYGSGYKTAGGIQGAYAFSGDLTTISGTNLIPLITKGGDPNRYDFDVDYSGGGPVVPPYNGTTRVGYLMSYHGEFWCNASNGCSNANSSSGSPNFYSALGLAFSVDGVTFRKMGQVVQPHLARAAVFAGNSNLEIGGGSMMIADASGNFIPGFANLADKSAAFLYIFFSDIDPTNSESPCNTSVHCIGVARAPYDAVVAAANGEQTAQFPLLFSKFYQGTFSEPATSSGNDQVAGAGHYTAVVADSAPLYPSIVYMTKTDGFLMTYSTGNNQINFRTGASLLSWSPNIASMQITQSGETLLEPSLLGESGDPLVSGGQPFVYYVKASNWAAQHWRSASYVSREISF
jgi:hypothetical protein